MTSSTCFVSARPPTVWLILSPESPIPVCGEWQNEVDLGTFFASGNTRIMTLSGATDLFVLTADSQIQRTIETLLTHRRRALNIRDITFDVQRHPRRDPGCRNASIEFLETTRVSHGKAMVVFDFDGSGEKRLNASGLEDQMEQEACARRWEHDRVAFVIIDPELEAWAFGAPSRAPTTCRGLERTGSDLRLVSFQRSSGSRDGKTTRPQNRVGSPNVLVAKDTIRKSVRGVSPQCQPCPLPGPSFPEVLRHVTAVVSCQMTFRETLNNAAQLWDTGRKWTKI